MKRASLIAGFIIAVALCFTVWAFSSAMTPYVDIRTAREIHGPVQVKGNILHQTVHWDSQREALCFQIQDHNSDKIWVVYKGPKPDAFDTAPETAATGVIQPDPQLGEVFVSTKMVVKCPSKYDDSEKGYKPGSGGRAT